MEASNFVSGVTGLVVGAGLGQGATDLPKKVRAGDADGDGDGHPDSEVEEQEMDVVTKRVPVPTEITAGAKDVRQLTSATEPHPQDDPAKKHVQAVVWEKARPAMRILEEVADTWERFGKFVSLVSR